MYVCMNIGIFSVKRVLGAFAKLLKAKLASSRVTASVRMEQFYSHWTDFHEVFEYFSKMSRKFRLH
jgi:hypothetical protein